MTTGSETFVRAADQLRLDSKVKAVVLRVESPGGSVTAADAMWRSLVRLAAVKPLIVSLGDVAASGGYYVAAPGRLIFASPETITGSIGVFYGKFDLSGLYEGLGVHKELTSGSSLGHYQRCQAMVSDRASDHSEKRRLLATCFSKEWPAVDKT